jgi:hypothetical protein
VFLDVADLRPKIERETTMQAVRERGPAAQNRTSSTLVGAHDNFED